MAKSPRKRGITVFTSAVAFFTAEAETEGPWGTCQPKVTLRGRTDCLIQSEYWFSEAFREPPAR